MVTGPNWNAGRQPHLQHAPVHEVHGRTSGSVTFDSHTASVGGSYQELYFSTPNMSVLGRQHMHGPAPAPGFIQGYGAPVMGSFAQGSGYAAPIMHDPRMMGMHNPALHQRAFATGFPGVGATRDMSPTTGASHAGGSLQQPHGAAHPVSQPQEMHGMPGHVIIPAVVPTVKVREFDTRYRIRAVFFYCPQCWLVVCLLDRHT